VIKNQEKHSFIQTMAITECKKKTAGEELWLIHLKRFQPTSEDFDMILPKRKRSKSIGQELFEVHLTRCQGCDSDYDCEKCQRDNNERAEPKITKSEDKKDTPTVPVSP